MFEAEESGHDRSRYVVYYLDDRDYATRCEFHDACGVCVKQAPSWTFKKVCIVARLMNISDVECEA